MKSLFILLLFIVSCGKSALDQPQSQIKSEPIQDILSKTIDERDRLGSCMLKCKTADDLCKSKLPRFWTREEIILNHLNENVNDSYNSQSTQCYYENSDCEKHCKFCNDNDWNTSMKTTTTSIKSNCRSYYYQVVCQQSPTVDVYCKESDYKN